MLKHPEYTRTRIRQLINRLKGKIYADQVNVTDLQVCGPTDRISYDEAQQLTDFEEAKLGYQFRPAWATFWLRGSVQVPQEWEGERVDLLWASRSEATLWLDGEIAQGLNQPRRDAILRDAAAREEKIDFQVEMTCSGLFGVGGRTGNEPVSHWYLEQCSIARFDQQAWDLYYDAYVLMCLENELNEAGATGDKSWAGHLLWELNRFCNVIDHEDRDTWGEAHQILKDLYQHRNASHCFELSVIGHAHIDTAWLWPIAETWRKCERSFTTATAYMRDYPEYKFSCSQAYQYTIIQQRQPKLYEKIKEYAAKGQWVPVGGSWIEPDCNIPSGESLCRQFLFGQQFFEREFGKRCTEFWNPDVFGYNGQLPQIMRQSGIERFLTQKLSWNRFNKPDNVTFIWEGIDGSEVLTHFPPADTYNAMVDGPNELRSVYDNVSKHKDLDRSNEGYMLFGFGDGGGGPTKQMLEVLRRCEDLQAVPRTQHRDAQTFFDRLEQRRDRYSRVVGELYFEYHRGTYTSQAKTKWNNRKSEQLLHDLELLATANWLAGTHEYPKEQIDALWEIVLLNQFHDILPGSSINQVYKDSEAQFVEWFEKGNALLAEQLGDGDEPINTIAVTRRELVEHDGELKVVEAQPMAAGAFVESADAVTLTETDDQFVLENDHLRAVFDRGGRLLSLIGDDTKRDAMAASGHVFEIYDDSPTAYDAWDIDPFHLETKQDCGAATNCEIVRHDKLRCEIAFDYPIGKKSKLRSVVRLDAESRRLEFHVESSWHERNKVLKVCFPVDARAMNATYEMQFGYVERPTHYNTSFDLAKYEVPMHRWFDLSEPGFGVAILNDCKYGGSTFDNEMRLTLLRAPKGPDRECDMGEHKFAFAVMPHAGDWRDAGVVAEGLRFNYPVQIGKASWDGSFAAASDEAVVVDTVKRSEDGQGVVVRCYEAHGKRGEVALQSTMSSTAAQACNVLEDPQGDVALNDGEVTMDYQPHKIMSVRLSR